MVCFPYSIYRYLTFVPKRRDLGIKKMGTCHSFLHAWMDGWMDGWVDGWMDGWMGGWMDGWVEGYKGVVVGLAELT